MREGMKGVQATILFVLHHLILESMGSMYGLPLAPHRTRINRIQATRMQLMIANKAISLT